MYDRPTLRAIWNKATPIPRYDRSEWRRDHLGNVIKFHDYGKRDSDHGWGVDYVDLVRDGGTKHLSNLRPVHWHARAQKGAANQPGSELGPKVVDLPVRRAK